MKTLLFIGHPGHELLAYKLLLSEKPDVVYLTTGSGNKNKSRIHESINLVNSLGLEVLFPFEPFSDRQIYDLILQRDYEPFLILLDTLEVLCEEKGYERVIGDALEGFNPSHDICRYLINGLVSRLMSNNKELANYDFLQDELHKGQDTIKEDSIVLDLSEDELQEKLKACVDYGELKFEVERFMESFGLDFFKKECFRRVTDLTKVINWDSEVPFYEEHGRRRVNEGVYEKLISFNENIKPLALALLR
ncbi:MAG: hypothetical protein JJ978_14900 [Roseivirga sp.]|jgi:hypothetical protein|uniref:hypothetical protein n=1 Tax=Roseivirga sp. TaxID=1964215 RepID=UPI001B0A9EB7|nr:hypothetical protein [Roseivirga sp.]MBO6496855.1 hypothetical protein [Roseivirga sp.]